MEKEKTIWEDDKLDRTSEGKFLYDYLFNRYTNSSNDEYESHVLNIDASWGLGKTFFLEHWSEDLKSKGHPVVSFNAWNSDFQNNPLIAFLTEIEKQLTEYFTKSKKAKEYIKNTFKGGVRLLKNSIPLLSAILLKQLSGISIEKIQAILNEDEPLDLNVLYNSDDELDKEDGKSLDKDPIVKSFVSLLSMYGKESLEKYVSQKKDIETFHKNFSKLVKYIESSKKTELPIFIIIDELDRCRPNYAIELLESIKHLFSIKGVYFVLATDTQQLCHSIKVIYGNGFDSSRYLNRFFDQTYEFQKSDYNTYAKYLFDRYKIIEKAPFLFSPLQHNELLETGDPNVEIFSSFSKYFNLTLRDQEQIISHLYTICLTWSEETMGKLHSPIILFLLMLRHNSRKKFKEFYLKKYNFDSWMINNSFAQECDQSVVIKQYKRPKGGIVPHPNNREIENITIQKLFDSYQHFVVRTLRQVMDRQAVGNDPLLKDSIKDDFMRNCNLNNTLPTNVLTERDGLNLLGYYEIVKQVGHLVKDKNFEENTE